MKLRLALAAATCLALPIAAHAQPVTGPYVSLEGGTSITNPDNFNESLKGTSGKELYRESYAGIFSAGYGFGNGFRVQISGDDLHNTIAKIDGPIAGKVRGPHTTFGGTVDALYDMDVKLPIFPYVGVGVGYEYVQNSIYAPIAYSDTKGSPAIKAIAGLAFPIDAVPGLSVTAEFDYYYLTNKTKYIESITGGFPAGSPTPGSITFQPQSNEAVFAGIRYALFTAPAMAPAPAPETPVAAPPAPPIARTYLVFFDWDKSDLTPRATQIIAQAATDSKTNHTTVLNVSGYTDTSGTPTYNQGLSVRRAKAVEGQLVADGVPASEIEIHAYGETHLLVPTGPGVREPQNRRVEIVLN
jgi:outer membrane protein OmpA-like peptidoglycan-associated protein